jgi:CMP-N-acetylneuraminate monooxygenase
MAHSELVLEIPLSALREEVNFVEDVIVHRAKDGTITAARNRCRHQAGRFRRQASCALTCANHGWILDACTMTYVNPSGGLRQPQLVVETTADGLLRLFEPVLAHPWDAYPVPREELRPRELTVRFMAHACAEIRCGMRSIVTDPWLVGPAFTRGWWLQHAPPPNWLETLAGADAIYVSHNHSDHLNPHTLARLAAVNARAPVYIPAFESDSCERLLAEAGLVNVTKLPFGVWAHLDADRAADGRSARFMILPDGAGRDDSCLLVEYKGHRILNTVDCGNPNGGVLPADVDVLLTSFAGGASGYPVCWPELYSEARIEGMLATRRRHLLQRAADLASATRARVYVPFAGYFVEAHPADGDVRSRNVKNTPQAACAAVARRSPSTRTWAPSPGELLDVATLAPVPGSGTDPVAPDYAFASWVRPIDDELDGPLASRDALHAYFRWAGYRGDLVLHVVETDETFSHVLRETFVDFRDLSFPEARPEGAHRYLRMRVRASVFRWALARGKSWEEISIGFQARFYRDPDVYDLGFWDHFQNRLPRELPDWAAHEAPANVVR